MELGEGGELNNAFIKFMNRSETFGIPGSYFPELNTAVGFAKNLNHSLQMSGKDADSLREPHFRRNNAGTKQGSCP